jgi:hypothetical protein
MKFCRKWVALALVLGLVLATGAWAAGERAEMIDGTHWSKWSQEGKLIYIRGLTNWADFISESLAQKGKTFEFCASRVMVDELKTKTLGQIVANIDAFYRDNPGKMNTSVIEVLIRRCTNVCPPEAGAKEGKK